MTIKHIDILKIKALRVCICLIVYAMIFNIISMNSTRIFTPAREMILNKFFSGSIPVFIFLLPDRSQQEMTIELRPVTVENTPS